MGFQPWYMSDDNHDIHVHNYTRMHMYISFSKVLNGAIFNSFPIPKFIFCDANQLPHPKMFYREDRS